MNLLKEVAVFPFKSKFASLEHFNASPGLVGQSFEQVDIVFDRSMNLQVKSMSQQFFCERVQTSLL